MNTHVPVRLPVCHMHANVYLETRIHIYKRTYVCTHTDRRTYASACIHTYGEPDKTSRDKTSHAIFLHPGQNIPQRFATPDKTSHAVFVTPDITSDAIFVTPDITSHAIFATPDKTSHTQTASSG